MTEIIYLILQVILFIIFAPFIQGVIKKTKALLQGRKGPSLWQGYYDLHKYFQKSRLISQDASWITKITPFIVFSVAVINSLSIVTIFVSPFRTNYSDILIFVYLYALSRFFLTLVGYDAGSTFGGMGASREVAIAVLAEPALFLAILAFTYQFDSLSFDNIALKMGNLWEMWLQPYVILSFVSFYILLITETGRLPVDNPDTHLELTMVHEGMVLEYTGRDLGLIFWGQWIKQLTLLALMVNLFFPFAGYFAGWSGLLIRGLLFLFKLLLLAISLGVVETFMAKLRFFRLPRLLALSMVLSFLAFLSQVI